MIVNLFHKLDSLKIEIETDLRRAVLDDVTVILRYQDRVEFLGTVTHRPNGSRAVKLFGKQAQLVRICERSAGVRLHTQLHRQSLHKPGATKRLEHCSTA